MFTFFGGSLWHFLDTRDSCLSLQCLLANTELNIVFLSVFLQQPSAGQRMFFFGITFAPASTGLQVSLLLLTLLSFLSYSTFSFPYIHVLKVSVHPNVWRFGDHLIWKVIVLYCMIYGITLVCSTTCQLNICIYIQNPYSLSTICLHFAYTYFWIISPHIFFVTALVFACSFENSIQNLLSSDKNNTFRLHMSQTLI